MPFYRYGNPGEDTAAHLNFGRKAGPARCVMPRFEKDDPGIGQMCGRMSVALCDAPQCDKPICDLHRTRHTKKANTDFCPDHKHMDGFEDGKDGW
jgi:hypothetical protein